MVIPVVSGETGSSLNEDLVMVRGEENPKHLLQYSMES